MSRRFSAALVAALACVWPAVSPAGAGEGIASWYGGRLVPAEGVLIDEVGVVRDVTGTDAEGWPIVAARPGWYANLRGYGPVVAAMTAGIEQYDAEGNLRPLFDRTRVLTVIPGLVWTPAADGVPGGYVGAHGVRIYDPATVAAPIRSWA